AVRDQRVGGGGRRVPAMAADRRLSLVAAEPLSPGDSLGPVPPLGLAGVDPLAALAWRCLDEPPAPANAAVKRTVEIKELAASLTRAQLDLERVELEAHMSQSGSTAR
ncbi:hypothetical protein MTO96_050803, partial [Rhipicephalus appendiculatus]